ncbi:hypothetical protein BGZ59_005121 [Podila verticillata]|nr:hypothetical protein BGZ59_005121 [Podila verticillata]
MVGFVSASAWLQSRNDNTNRNTNLNKTEFETWAELNQYVLKTPVSFAGNQYLPQVPIPENIDITKVYVSEVALPTKKYYPPQNRVSQYVRYYFDAHVFLAPLKGQQEITFPAKTEDNLYEISLWGHKIRTAWDSDAPCTYCKEQGSTAAPAQTFRKRSVTSARSQATLF